MRGLFELIAGFIALLAALALSPFGVDLKSAPKAEREVHRVADCRAAPPGGVADHPRTRC